MECPACGTENKPDAVFCMLCGASLPDVPFSQLEKKETTRPPGGAAAAAPRPTPEAAGPVPGPPERPPAPQEPTVEMPAGGVAPPPAPAAATPQGPPAPAQPPAGMRSTVEDIIATPQAPPAPPQPTAGMRSTVEEIIATPQAPPAADTPPAPPPQAPPATAPQPVTQAPPQPAFYIPPEADYVKTVPTIEPVPRLEPPVVEAPPPAATRSQDSTQTIAPVVAAATTAGRERKSVCPECYAPNPEGNGYCQECGSALPAIGAKSTAAARPATPPAPGQTAAMPATAAASTAVKPAYSSETTLARAARGEKAFGVADILALLAIGAGAVSIALSYVLDSFTWKKGLDIAIFSHQGAYSPGRTDLLGGPGILPYEGAEFFTIGLVVGIGLALALVFLALRVGRGPMFILAGCLLLLPAAYLLFQALLPLRQMGIDVDPALGLSGVFFGDSANAGVGISFWIITAAGALLVVAGFIAPPRGWGRLFTFLLCFSAVLGIAFFCAACYNWNLFISQPAAASQGAGRIPGGAYVSRLLAMY